MPGRERKREGKTKLCHLSQSMVIRCLVGKQACDQTGGFRRGVKKPNVLEKFEVLRKALSGKRRKKRRS